jgi:hypothetical protein
LEQAVAFLQGLTTNGTVTLADGTKVNLATYGAAGLFGSDTATVQAAINKVLSDTSLNVPVTIKSPFGGNATITDTTTGKPATYADMLLNPNHTFSFTVSYNTHFPPLSQDQVSWDDNFHFQDVNVASSGTITTDGQGNQIPGGGLNYSSDSSGHCFSAHTDVTISGSGEALLNYINAPTGGTSSANINADTEIVGNYLNQDL